MRPGTRSGRADAGVASPMRRSEPEERRNRTYARAVTDPAVHQSSAVTIRVDGEAMTVPAGASLAAVLLLQGVDGLRRSEPSHRLRGVFCGMGSCHECGVTVDGLVGVRSCLTPVADGMEVVTDRGRG
jgi:D-hydroxyproline dehydrogenase subunit gamma